jgi:hypothetical protein
MIPIPEKSLRLSQMPLKDELKLRKTEQSVVIKQTVPNFAKKQQLNIATNPVNCSYPDFKSIVLQDPKIDFTKKEITRKPNSKILK